MGVFAVARDFGSLEREVQGFGHHIVDGTRRRAKHAAAVEPRGDLSVVGRGVREGRTRELVSSRVRERAGGGQLRQNLWRTARGS